MALARRSPFASLHHQDQRIADRAGLGQISRIWLDSCRQAAVHGLSVSLHHVDDRDEPNARQEEAGPEPAIPTGLMGALYHV